MYYLLRCSGLLGSIPKSETWIVHWGYVIIQSSMKICVTKECHYYKTLCEGTDLKDFVELSLLCEKSASLPVPKFWRGLDSPQVQKCIAAIEKLLLVLIFETTYYWNWILLVKADQNYWYCYSIGDPRVCLLLLIGKFSHLALAHSSWFCSNNFQIFAAIQIYDSLGYQKIKIYQRHTSDCIFHQLFIFIYYLYLIEVFRKSTTYFQL